MTSQVQVNAESRVTDSGHVRDRDGVAATATLYRFVVQPEYPVTNIKFLETEVLRRGQGFRNQK